VHLVSRNGPGWASIISIRMWGASAGKAVGHFANLVVEDPPFLDHDQAGVALTLMSPEHMSAFLRVQIAQIGASTTGRLFDDCDSVMPRIGVRGGPIHCHKTQRMRADLS